MPAPVSSSAAQFGLAQSLFGLASRADVDAYSSNAAARQASFSSTLQSQFDRQAVASGRNVGAEPSVRAPEPERRASAEAAREPARQPEREPVRSDAERAAESSERGESPGNGGAQDTSSGSSDSAAPQGKSAHHGHSDGSHDHAREGRSAAEEADATAALAASGDSTTIAGLPADLAALLPQLAAARVAEGSANADPLADDSAGKSLQNSGLLPRTDANAQGSERGIANPLVLIQAREAAASVAAGKATAGLQAVEGETAVSAKALPGGSALHQPGEFAALRQQAIAARAATPQLPVPTPAGQEGWAEDVGNRVTWMLGRAESKADLVLTPAGLGKLEVSINLNGDQTTAQFIASSQAARNALEQALPRLREILSQAGINLGEANVSTSGEQQAGGDGSRDGSRRSGDSAPVGAAGAGVRWLSSHDGMVDTFV